MPRDMFGDVVDPSIKVGGQKWYTVPLSILVHTVLIAAVNAIVIGYLVFADRLSTPSSRLVTRLREAPSNLTLIALILIILIVIASKALTGRGTPLSGGMPSGHAALAFGGFTALAFIVDEDERVVVSFVALIMALLVAQTRVESGINTTSEVVLGAVIGTLVTMILFQVLA